MNKIKEVTKNFFVCAVLMMIAGIALMVISKKGLGIAAIIFGLLFLGIGIVFLIKDLKGDDDK
ncbi:MAG: hypothetical protein HFJ06_09485 [Lachnospiraceae bacterium]|nr:hypothetical protein [Lachnospiraceae bacterium]